MLRALCGIFVETRCSLSALVARAAFLPPPRTYRIADADDASQSPPDATLCDLVECEGRNYLEWPLFFVIRPHRPTGCCKDEAGPSPPLFLYLFPGAAWWLIFTHGNATDLGAIRQELADLCAALQVNICAVEYQGYGEPRGSPVRPSEAAAYRDAEIAYDWLTRSLHVDPRNVICLGQSIGSAIATHLVASRPVRGLILHSPMASGLRVVCGHARSAACCVACLRPCDPLRSVDRVARLRLPTPGSFYVFHGREDEVIHVSHTELLMERLPRRLRPPPLPAPPAPALEPARSEGDAAAKRGRCESWPPPGTVAGGAADLASVILGSGGSGSGGSSKAGGSGGAATAAVGGGRGKEPTPRSEASSGSRKPGAAPPPAVSSASAAVLTPEALLGTAAHPWLPHEAGHNDIALLYRVTYVRRLRAFLASLALADALAAAEGRELAPPQTWGRAACCGACCAGGQGGYVDGPEREGAAGREGGWPGSGLVPPSPASTAAAAPQPDEASSAAGAGKSGAAPSPSGSTRAVSGLSPKLVAALRRLACTYIGAPVLTPGQVNEGIRIGVYEGHVQREVVLGDRLRAEGLMPGEDRGRPPHSLEPGTRAPRFGRGGEDPRMHGLAGRDDGRRARARITARPLPTSWLPAARGPNPEAWLREARRLVAASEEGRRGEAGERSAAAAAPAAPAGPPRGSPDVAPIRDGASSGSGSVPAAPLPTPVEADALPE